MKRRFYSPTLGFLFLFFCLGAMISSILYETVLPPRKHLEKLTHYGHLGLGWMFPKYGGWSLDKVQVGPTIPKGLFHVHLLGDVPYTSCLDMECSPLAKTIIKRGGHLQMSCDFKATESVGINTIHNGKKWIHEDTLMIVNDSEGKIIAIYRNAKLSDIPRVLDELNL